MSSKSSNNTPNLWPNIVKKRVHEWLHDPYDIQTQHDVQSMINTQGPIVDAFYTTISFGTGGMRGVMGIGTNRINIYTIRYASQGLSNYILQQKINNPRVFISYDSRNHSYLFAQEASRVFAGNGITALITTELRPTPYVSFGCRYHNCIAAIMITASHNPPEYNGYKVYWNDGAQVLAPHDHNIITEIRHITHPSQVQLAPFEHQYIKRIPSSFDAEYLKAINSLQNHPTTNHKNGHTLSILYSSLHGCGSTILPQALHQWGFTNLSYVAKQCEPNGLFPTTESPNPEDPQALEQGIKQLLQENKDIFLATDPDADRIGVVVSHKGKAIQLNGNQIAIICLYYLCNNHPIKDNHAVATTIVTTDLFSIIAKDYNIAAFEVLTGFKYIGEKIREWEDSQYYTFLFGAEESLGFLYGTHSRDKDAIISGCLIAEIALQCKIQNHTLIDFLNTIYDKYGYFSEYQHSLPFQGGKEGMEKIHSIMKQLREHPPTQLGSHKITKITDYLSNDKTLSLPKSNVLLFRLDDNSKYIIRPSGTEPKIKIYGLAPHKNTQIIKAIISEICEYITFSS